MRSIETSVNEHVAHALALSEEDRRVAEAAAVAVAPLLPPLALVGEEDAAAAVAAEDAVPAAAAGAGIAKSLPAVGFGS